MNMFVSNLASHVPPRPALWLLFCLLLFGVASALPAADADDVLKTKAYEAYQQSRFADAAADFEKYFQKNPQDVPAALDYSSVLLQLKRPADAARVLETIHKQTPQNETAYFKLGQVYASLRRFAEGEKVFQDLANSTNPDLAIAAGEALRTLRAEMSREATFQSEQQVYKLAGEFKHGQALELINELEKKGPLSFAMEVQRLYSLQALGQHAPALKRAEELAKEHPAATELALLRADLLADLGRRGEAEEIWRKIQRENAGTSAALTAGERLQGAARPEEDAVYRLAGQRKFQEVIEAVARLEAQGKLSWPMEMQRLFAWQSLGQFQTALAHAAELAKKHPASNDLALVRAQLLIKNRQWEEASILLKQVKERSPDTPVARQADNLLDAIPAIANLDKWYWGEAYLSGDYLGRFGSVIGSGFARHGWFIPKARWLQPYVEHRFTVDTRSGLSRERSLIADNFVAFSGGVRAQPFPTEYFFLYISAGINKDLLDRREDGDWCLDYQGGLYAFKSWGPGTVLLSHAPNDTISASGQLPAASTTSPTVQTPTGKTNLLFWRGDWFVDAGADFSYYHRFSSWLGYGQAHEGFRLFQIGPRAAFDAYAVENISWDVRGNYFDNLIEIGPGARFLWVPRKRWEVVLRSEYLNGFYLGRDDLGNRGSASGHYDDVRVGLSLGVRW